MQRKLYDKSRASIKTTEKRANKIYAKNESIDRSARILKFKKRSRTEAKILVQKDRQQLSSKHKESKKSLIETRYVETLKS